MSPGLLQVFVELGNLHGTSNYVLYWNHGGRLFWFRLPWPGTSVKYSCILLACSEDWTCNLQIIVFLVAQGTNVYNRYVVEITIKMKTIVRKTLMIKINNFRLRNLDNKHLKKVGGHIGRNVVEITIKMKTIVRKTLMMKIIKLRLRNLDN